MKAVLQRVSEASVAVEGEVIGQIGTGLLVLLCAERGDTDAHAERMLAKILKLRIFGDGAGKMNRSVQDVAGGLLVVSQFKRLRFGFKVRRYVDLVMDFPCLNAITQTGFTLKYYIGHSTSENAVTEPIVTQCDRYPGVNA